MRKTAVLLALLLVASLGVAVPSAGAASGEPKVVIIVGATHGATSSYRAYADAAYAEAIKYTSNVVKVYSPNATWVRVKAAVSGASVVIYMGHGNGWPSPYTYDASYSTKDGFGLNATEGAGDSNNVYYGEPYVSTLELAPGAVVLLHHLCYAAGNSEPGQAEPSVSVARERVDNYAAGFLKAGAAAVIADGHAGPESYLRALFTSEGTIESLWATQPNATGNIVSFPSARTPGATAYQDPTTPTSGFYRALVVRSARMTIAAEEPNLYTDPAPEISSLTPGPSTIPWFSPNGDGNRETVALIAVTSKPALIAVAARDAAGSTLKTWTVTSGLGPATIRWDGRDDAGNVAPDGRYILSVVPSDAAGNTGAAQDRTVSLVTGLGLVASSTTVFFPQDLDQLAPTTELSFGLSRPMTVTWTIRDTAANVIDTHLAAVPLPAGTQTWAFDGRRSDGTMLSPGRYLSYVVARDGTLVAAQSIAFEADAFLIKPADATPGRGQTIRLTLTSAEPLAASPRLSVNQPGMAAWSVGTVKLSNTTYRATIKLRAGGSGTVTFTGTGVDIAGATQQTSRSFPLH